MRYSICTIVLLAACAHAQAAANHQLAEDQALDLAKRAIALRSVRGPGNSSAPGRRAVQVYFGCRRLLGPGHHHHPGRRHRLSHRSPKAIRLGYPNVPVFPSMSSGASDSMWFRHENVLSYGVSPVFMKTSDEFSHGLNERVPITSIPPSITYLLSLVTDLAH